MVPVLLIQRIFSHYRKGIFECLSKCYDFRLVCLGTFSDIKTHSAHYSREARNVLTYKKAKFFIPNEIFKVKYKVIICEFAIQIVSLPLLLLLSKLLFKKLILWSHGYDRRKGFSPHTSFLDRYRLFFLKHADAILVYGSADKIKLSQFVSEHKIFVAQNSLDSISINGIMEDLQKGNRRVLKERLGFKRKLNIVFIGRLISSKKPEILLRMLEHLKPDIRNNTQIHFIGDGPVKSSLVEYSSLKGLSNHVTFYGAIYNDFHIGEILYCSDLMILPGEVGLSVNHSLMFGCPVVSFKRSQLGPFHGPEEEHIKDGKTGFWVEENNIESLVFVVSNYYYNPTLQVEMRGYINEYSNDWLTTKRMFDGIKSAIDYVTMPR